MKALRVLSLMVILLWGLALCPAWAQDKDEEDDSSESVYKALAVQEKQQAAVGQLADISQKLSEQEVKAMEDLASGISRAHTITHALALQETLKPMPFDYELTAWSAESMRSAATADILNNELNDVYRQSVQGNQYVAGQGVDEAPNVYLQGRVRAIAELYQSYVDLFCIPGTPNAPKDCGAARADYKIKGSENFVDFFLSEKTWPRKTVFEVMKLARGYFGYIPDLDDLSEIQSGGKAFLEKQTIIARSALKMSIINYLAAQRAPTSSSTAAILTNVLLGLAPSGTVESLDYQAICDKEKKTAQEVYACSFTNDPEERGGARLISQAAIDRIMQYDFYRSPHFYSELNSSYYNADGPLDRLEVFMKAQQVTQDYQFLRMLQMKTIAVAASLMDDQKIAKR